MALIRLNQETKLEDVTGHEKWSGIVKEHSFMFNPDRAAIWSEVRRIQGAGKFPQMGG